MKLPTFLARVLPCHPEGRASHIEQVMRVRLTPDGKAHPAFQGVEHDWTKAPELISIVGVGMRSHAGIASTMFEALAKEGINIRMISTSEIKVSVVVDEKYLELGVRALHDAFNLEQAPAA